MWERYAVEHGMEDMAQVPKRVTARSFERWRMLRLADRARHAWEHATSKDVNWATDLSEDERGLIAWTEKDNADTN